MADKDITLLCYWNGRIVERLEGFSYDKPPNKAIKVKLGISYIALLNKMYSITSWDRHKFRIKMTCRYPSVVGQILKYIPIPIKDDDDVDITFDALAKHLELSNLDLYLEAEVISSDNGCPSNQVDINFEGSHDQENEMDINFVGRGIDWDAIPSMTTTEDFNCLSQNAVMNNVMLDEDDINEELSLDDIVEEEQDRFDTNDNSTPDDDLRISSQGTKIEHDSGVNLHEVPSMSFTNLEGIDGAMVSNWSLQPTGNHYTPNQELCRGLIFKDKENVIRAVKLYSIRRNKRYEVVESCPTIWRLRCKNFMESGCGWKLHACKRRTHGLFEITQYSGPHSCLHSKLSQDHPHIDARLIANEVQHLVKEQPFITVSALRAEIMKILNYTVSYKKVWNGKQKAIEQVFGDWDHSYSVLPKFMTTMQYYNQGTIVEWCIERLENTDEVRFQRVFWAFAPSIEGFKHCRPVISIDATHLYGKYKGKMMIAMGIDGNNQILPLAFAIVEEENFSCWHWFLHHVKHYVVQERQGICLISDRHNGILKTVNENGSSWIEPYGFHRYCLRHFISNFNTKFKDSHLKILAYQASCQNQVCKFNAIMDEIEKINPRARQWLEKHLLVRWALSHDGGRRYGIMTTNLSEIFNSVLKGARYLPITACVQLTFYRLVHYFDVRRSLGINAKKKGELYTPHVVSTEAALMLKATAHTLKSFNRDKGLFKVVTQKGKNVQIVNLEKGTCSCGKWEINKYPCSHVLSVCGNLSLNSWQYTQKYYSIEEYCMTWASEFFPLHHEEYWPAPTFKLIPDHSLRRSEKGRPRSPRLQNEIDIKEGVHLSVVEYVEHKVMIEENAEIDLEKFRLKLHSEHEDFVLDHCFW